MMDVGCGGQTVPSKQAVRLPKVKNGENISALTFPLK
jgi:hypothetical protein